MNSASRETNAQRIWKRRRRESGNSLLEVALTISLLIVLGLGATDFARVFYAAIEVSDAARAGAQYGSQNSATAADSVGMVNAAKANAPNLTGVTGTASQCTCTTGSTVAACATSYCANNPSGNFVTVNTQAAFRTIAPYPGIPSALTLAGRAVMVVGQ
jgi:Flp pilus assembly protein TadG